MKRLIYFTAMLVVWLVVQSQDIELAWEHPSDMLFDRYTAMDGGSALTVIIKVIIFTLLGSNKYF